jgi:hypothetical protein
MTVPPIRRSRQPTGIDRSGSRHGGGRLGLCEASALSFQRQGGRFHFVRQG